MRKQLLLTIILVQAAVLVNMTRLSTISYRCTDSVGTTNSPLNDYFETYKPNHVLRRIFHANQETGFRRRNNRVSIEIEGQKVKKLMKKTTKVTTSLSLTKQNALKMEVKWFNRMY
jgi:hypothetical protein